MEKIYIKRLLPVPNRSYFLFGPRGVGKSTWLEKTMGDALFFDLLDSSLYLELSQNPMNLEALAGNIPEGSWIVIDEIQKIPPLLDEVHRLMEKKRW
ncbi:MAG: AAA family ATPase, partial [Candidatus Aminicenantes bacterium]